MAYLFNLSNYQKSFEDSPPPNPPNTRNVEILVMSIGASFLVYDNALQLCAGSNGTRTYIHPERWAALDRHQWAIHLGPIRIPRAVSPLQPTVSCPLSEKLDRILEWEKVRIVLLHKNQHGVSTLTISWKFRMFTAVAADRTFLDLLSPLLLSKFLTPGSKVALYKTSLTLYNFPCTSNRLGAVCTIG